MFRFLRDQWFAEFTPVTAGCKDSTNAITTMALVSPVARTLIASGIYRHVILLLVCGRNTRWPKWQPAWEMFQGVIIE